jgi:Ca2+-binding RTX toxin-like protein
MVLGMVAAVLCLLLVLAGTSMGLTGSTAFSQPSPSGSPSGPSTQPGTIFLLNPNQGFIPATTLEEPPKGQGAPSLPKISDKFDGRDRAYHIVAAVSSPPPNAFVEAYWEPDGSNEITAGQLTPVPGNPSAYELYWDIPDNVGTGLGILRVRLYQQTASGFEEISAHEVTARMQHKTSGQIREAETVALTWPSSGGPLGFYKGGGIALWRTVLNGTGSPALNPPADQGQPPSTGIDQARLFYSTSPPGTKPEFLLCGTVTSSAGGPEGSEQFGVTCPLQGKTIPPEVTAIAAVAMQDQDPGPVANYTVESTDVSWVRPYVQTPDQMKLLVESSTSSFYPNRRRSAAGGTPCLMYELRALDHLDRPVQGANVDVHIQGPNDQVLFGHDRGGTVFGSTANYTSLHANPGKHSTENAFNCYANNPNNDPDEHLAFEQAETNVPAGNDVKHLESAAGTGLSTGAGVSFGEFRFGVYSRTPGFTDITAWIDEENLADLTEKRELDDDLPEPAEAKVTNFAQWLRSTISVTLDPTGKTSEIGTCTRYLVKVRDGSTRVPDANVDIHAVGPSSDLDFCDPSDGSPRAAPNAGTDHNAEDAGEAAHSGNPPTAQHTEGRTNDQGNFVIGLTSPGAGDTTITAWYDGEETFDNDTLDTAEPRGTATVSWLTGEAKVSWLNPTAYGSGSPGAGNGLNVGKKNDVDGAYHLVARAASILPIAGVEFFVRTGSNPLVRLGEGVRVGETDTYELYWPVDVTDGSHTLVARIIGTQVVAEQTVTVNNNPPPQTSPDPTDVPFETAEITVPRDGARATFDRGKLTIKGVASSGAEGVDLYYTKASALTTPAGGDWIFCGFAGVTPGSAPVEFSGDCTLQGPDQPGQVTGVAALTYDCVQSGCNAGPTAGPRGTRNPGSKDSGDAHRVFGVEASPTLSVEPAETAADVGACQRFEVILQDQTGQPVPGQNVDAHLTGPGNGGNFCSPPDGTDRRAPDQGDHLADGNETDEGYHDDGAGRVHHTEGDTTSNGRFILGIESATEGDSTLTLWLDADDDDVQDQDEVTDFSTMHWEGEGAACDIQGTDDGDTLVGTSQPERICGFGGNDTIRGGGGGDVILGGAGRDSLRGHAASDTIIGGRGHDTLKGNRGNDRLSGGMGRDFLDGGKGRDECSGGRGRDRQRRCEPHEGSGGRGFAARTRSI